VNRAILRRLMRPLHWFDKRIPRFSRTLWLGSKARSYSTRRAALPAKTRTLLSNFDH
jgi:hypothetical protein